MTFHPPDAHSTGASPVSSGPAKDRQAEGLGWIDSHCHLDFPAFDSDRVRLWQECRTLGITQLIIPGTDPQQWQRASALIRELPGLNYAAGLHPWWIASWLAQYSPAGFNAAAGELLRQQLQQALAEERCLALGETGLDARLALPIALQLELLDVHLQLAQELARPLIFHSVRAHQPLQQRLRALELPAGAVVHAFSGSYEIARAYWDRGVYLGIGGSITYERASKTRDAVKRLPLEALLLETDAPDMPLQGAQGQRNSPLQLVAVAEALAALRGEPLAQIAAQTRANTQRLFGM